MALHKQKLRLTNVSPLPLTMNLRAAAPFAVNRAEVCLKPEEEVAVEISYDPNYPGDTITRRYADDKHRLQLSFKEHPQKLYVPLCAQTHFPNLAMDRTEGNFGCLLNDAPAKLSMTLSNPSEVGAYYSWSFSDGGAGAGAGADASLPFDILPIRGFLEAGA